jgi:CRP-like cAMP-binding protein
MLKGPSYGIGRAGLQGKDVLDMKGPIARRMDSLLCWPGTNGSTVGSAANEDASHFGRSILSELHSLAIDGMIPGHSSLFSEGDAAGFVHIISSGYLKLTGRLHGREMVLQVAGPHSVLGLQAVLSNGAYETSACALTTTYFRSIERSELLECLRSDPGLHALAVGYICEEYRTALQAVCRIGLEDTAAKRLGRLLVKLGNQIGERLESGKVRFPLVLTQEELGSMISIARETVVRTLSDFRERGWIDITNSLVTLEQPEYL